MDLYQIFITHNRSWSVRETIIFFLLLFLIVGLLLRQLKYGKLEKTQSFCSDRIICFRKHRFWIYCIYTDIRKKNV